MLVSQIILGQLGGYRFLTMCGIENKNLLGGPNHLSIKLPRNPKNITHVKIELNRGKDLYEVKFFKIRGTNIKVVSQFEEIFADQLQDLFDREVGLLTHV